MLPAIVGRVGQDPALLHRHGLHLFVGGGETAVLEVEVAGLFDQVLQGDDLAPIAVRLPQCGERGLDHLASFASRPLLGLGSDHALRQQGQDEGELLLALCLRAEDATGLFGLAAPEAISGKHRRLQHGGDLLVGVGALARAKLVQALPEGHERGIDHLAGELEEAQGLLLDRIRQADGVTLTPLSLFDISTRAQTRLVASYKEIRRRIG